MHGRGGGECWYSMKYVQTEISNKESSISIFCSVYLVLFLLLLQDTSGIICVIISGLTDTD